MIITIIPVTFFIETGITVSTKRPTENDSPNNDELFITFLV